MAKTKPPWQSRIVGYGEEAPGNLMANPRNWRTHPDEQVSALGGVMREVGIVQNVIVNKRTGHLIDGHARVEEAVRIKQPTIPITYVDLSEEEEALILATLDPITALAQSDTVKLDALLHDVSTADPAIMAMLDELAFDVDPVVIGDDGESVGSTMNQSMRKPASTVKAVFSVAQLAIVERAIQAVGTPNRGEAFTQICEAYLAQAEV